VEVSLETLLAIEGDFCGKDRTNEDNFKKSQQINDERVTFGNFTRNTHAQGLSMRAKKIEIGIDIHQLQFFKG
jgi:hypothetical protein